MCGTSVKSDHTQGLTISPKRMKVTKPGRIYHPVGFRLKVRAFKDEESQLKTVVILMKELGPLEASRALALPRRNGSNR